MNENFPNCGECGRNKYKISRNYFGKQFCEKCYLWEFQLGECKSCKKTKRVPTFDAPKLCLKCEKKKPCVRCGRSNRKIGKVTRYGIVCVSCTFYFSKPQKCEMCGVNTRRRAKHKHLSHELAVCLKCSRKQNETCPSCKRFRLLVLSDQGKRVCKACAMYVVRNCEHCGQEMPAGYGRRCESCYWKGLLKKRQRLNRKALSNEDMIAHFDAFTQWLEQRVGNKKAAITINKYIPFFIEIDGVWGSVPNYEALANHFGTDFDGLSKYRLPMKWMSKRKFIIVDDLIKESIAAKFCIKKYLLEFKDGLFNDVINDYSHYLEEKVSNGNLKVRSARVALTPALGLLRGLESGKDKLPDQHQLDDYLVKKPGQKNSLSGFIVFLNNEYSLDLKLRIDLKKVRKYEEATAERTLITLFKSGSNEMRNKNWVINSLIYFHKVSKTCAYKIFRNSKIKDGQHGFYMQFRNKEYFIPTGKKD